MDWEAFTRLATSSVTKVKAIQQSLGCDTAKFEPGVFTGEENLRRVCECLGTRVNRKGLPIGPNTIRGYLCAINSVLKSIGMDDEAYRRKEAELQKEIDATPYVRSVDQQCALNTLKRLVEKSPHTTALLAGLIYYNCDPMIEMKILAETRCDEDQAEHHYLDIKNRV